MYVKTIILKTTWSGKKETVEYKVSEINEVAGIWNIVYLDILFFCTIIHGQAHRKRASPLNDYMAWSFQELRYNRYPTLNGHSYVLAASTGVWLKSIALTCISRIVTQFPPSLPAVARLPAQLHQMSGLSCMVWPTLVGGGMGGQQTIIWQCRRPEEEEVSLSKSHEKQD